MKCGKEIYDYWGVLRLLMNLQELRYWGGALKLLFCEDQFSREGMKKHKTREK
jgi:hypothetical protein